MKFRQIKDLIKKQIPLQGVQPIVAFLLERISSNSNLFNDLVLLDNRYSNFISDVSSHCLDDSEKRVVENQITHALISFVDELDSNDFDEEIKLSELSRISDSGSLNKVLSSKVSYYKEKKSTKFYSIHISTTNISSLHRD